jgi:pyruvate dehydrogenase E1 component alpha subunit
MTDRFGPHSMSGDDPLRYRSQDDIDAWKQLDPLHRYEAWLIQEGKWSLDDSEVYRAEINALIDEEVRLADQAPKQKISDFLKHTFETPTYTIQEDINRYESEDK